MKHSPLDPIEEEGCELEHEGMREAKPVQTETTSPKKSGGKLRAKTSAGKKKSAHFGDDDFSLENKNISVTSKLILVDEDWVTYNEIWQSCCFHSSNEWTHIVAGTLVLFVCLYFFLFGMQLMGNASKVMAGCASGELFGNDVSPLSSLMVGILSTVLLQSSTATVAVIVALEEAGAMSVRAGIFTIMGANIGTTITPALVTLGQMRNLGELERGVAAASVHSLFNFMTVAVLFPIELCFGYLEAVSGILVATAETGGKDETYVGPIKRIIQPFVDVIIVSNSKLITGVAKGKSCESYYPIECDPAVEPSFSTCKVGLIGCNKETGRCPVFFREDASIFEDKLSGGFTFLLSLAIIVLSSMGLIMTIKFLLNGLSVRVVHAVTRCNGYVGIIFGGLVTVIVQSSQVVISTLVPFAGVGALPLETIFPIVVGSNVGTALQTVLTSLSAFGAPPLQVALAHLFFNVTGLVLWYPLPHLRSIPLWAATRLGQRAKAWRLFPIVSILISYLVGPAVLFGLSELYLTDNVFAKASVILLVVASGLVLIWILYGRWVQSSRTHVQSKPDRKRSDSLNTAVTAGCGDGRPCKPSSDELSKQSSCEQMEPSESFVDSVLGYGNDDVVDDDANHSQQHLDLRLLNLQAVHGPFKSSCDKALLAPCTVQITPSTDMPERLETERTKRPTKQPMNETSAAAGQTESELEERPERRLTFKDTNMATIDEETDGDEEKQKEARRCSSKRKKSPDDDLIPPKAPRRKRPAHFGDDDFAIDTVNQRSLSTRLIAIEEDSPTWEEIGQSCCFHSSNEWFHIVAGVLALLVCLYFFMFGMQLMGSASKVMAGCASGGLFGGDSNALTSLMVGIITTVLLQSSSAAVAVTVALEEAGAMSVRAGIFTIMGANIGTTITSALVTLGQMRDLGELERGVAAASVHSLFNFMTVAVLFPIELCFGYLEAVSGILVDTAETGGKEDTYVGPIKRIVQPLVDFIIVSNSKLVTGVAKGKSCESYYPIECDPDFEPSYHTCKVGLIGCNKESGRCPLFFREDSTMFEDKLAGGFTFLLSLGIIVLSTMGLINAIKFLLAGLSVRIVHAVTRCNGYVGILIGGALTVLCQSSQIVVSTLVPFAGVGALPLETIYPIVVGSNVGTALQTVLTSLSAFGAAPLQVALAHLFFNVTGLLLWYPLPHLRAIPLWGASVLGHNARIWRLFPIVCIVLLYLVVPFLVFGLTELYLVEEAWAKVFVVLVTSLLVLALIYTVYWCKYQGGVQKYIDFVSKLSRKRPDSTSTEQTADVSHRSRSYTKKTVSARKVEFSSRSFPLYGSESSDDENKSSSEEVQI